jgi:hypothetical protein
MPLRAAMWTLLLLSVLVLPGCEAIGMIFEAGMWVGLIGAAVIIGLLVFVFSRFRR